MISRKSIRLVSLTMLMVLALIAYLPVANAHLPSWRIPMYVYVTAGPNPIGVGQTAVVVWFCDKLPPTAEGKYGDRWENVEVTITKPDGSTEKHVTPRSDPVGTGWFTFTPDTAGTYKLQAHFPEQVLKGENPPPEGYMMFVSGEYINDTYLESTSEIYELTVLPDPVPGYDYADLPGPSDYWTRPIDAENREWWRIASNFLGSPDIRGSVQPYGTSPDSAHIVWTKPITFGGIVDGKFGDIPYYEGLSYEGYFNTPIIIQGRLYYSTPKPPMYGFMCADLYTGEEIWWRNGTGPFQMGWGFAGQNYPMLSMGQLLFYDSPNQHGVDAYLWSTYTDYMTIPGTNITVPTTVWAMYDAFTGNWICSISGVPGGGVMFGASSMWVSDMGDIMIYELGPVNPMTGASTNEWIKLWNSTHCLQNNFWTSNPMVAQNWFWMWRPPLGQTQPASTGYMNATGSLLNGATGAPLPAELEPTASFVGLDLENEIMLFSTDVPMLGYAPLPTPKTQNHTAIRLDKGHEGELLWREERPWHPGNVTIQLGPMGSGVYTTLVKETVEWYGYNLTTGEKLWGPTEPGDPWDMYSGSWVAGTVAYDRLYYAGYGGILYCYDIKNGSLLWTYESESSPDIPYPRYPLSIGSVNDGKIFLYTSEHSPTKPFMPGAKLRCVDAYEGNELWTIDLWCSTGFGGGLPISDGYLVTLNSYDNQIYCFGRGQTATTVTTSSAVITNGSSVLIQGTVTDQSPDVAGTPAIGDEYMTAWMEYLYMQHDCPMDVNGVPVKLEAFGEDGSYLDIGTVTSDPYGNFNYVWTPPDENLYTVMATFGGSNSYFSSYAATGLSVGAAPPVVEPEPEPEEPAYTAVDLAIIAAVAVAIIIGLVNLWALRKRT